MSKLLPAALVFAALVGLALLSACSAPPKDGCGACSACGGGCGSCGGCDACAGCGCDGCDGCGCDGCGCGGCGCGGCGCGGGSKVSSEDARHAMLLFRQYKKWHKANASAFKSKPHGQHMVYDYVNGTGARTFRENKGAYKPGAAIAKEGWKQGKRKMVWLMEKRGSGYDAGSNDWWYAAVTSAGEVKNAGKIQACIDCHSPAPNDYVFGLPK